jgi:hypothetical protein
MTAMHTSQSSSLEVHVRRIHGEYLEMPGLRLTHAQAERLWGLDTGLCADVLQVLVETGFLRRTDTGQYVRVTDGSTDAHPFRMARATLSQTAPHRAAG